VKSSSNTLLTGGAREQIVLSRRPQLAGVEVKTVFQATRPRRVFHESYEIFCPLVGASRHTFLGESISRRPGELMLYEPGDFHTSTHFEPGSAFHVLSIEAHVIEAAMPRACKRRRFRTSQVTSLELSRAVGALVAEIHEPNSSEDVQSAFVALNDQLMRQAADDSDDVSIERGQREHRAIACMRESLHADLQAAVSLDQLAQRAGFNKYYLLRVFKTHFGTTPQAYRQALRVARARSLLRSHEPSAVSALLGFADLSHFRRTFVKYVGMSPSQYRRAA
jgi:AraC-like DNA-binding protein